MEEVVELKKEVEDLRRLVHTLLTVIMEESDGSAQALRPTGVEGIPRGYSMWSVVYWLSVDSPP